jgi:hypothetical protein
VIGLYSAPSRLSVKQSAPPKEFAMSIAGELSASIIDGGGKHH